MSERTPYALAAAALTNPLWLHWIQPAYQALVAILGLVVLVLTIRNKAMDHRLKRAELARLEARDDDDAA